MINRQKSDKNRSGVCLRVNDLDYGLENPKDGGWSQFVEVLQSQGADVIAQHLQSLSQGASELCIIRHRGSTAQVD